MAIELTIEKKKENSENMYRNKISSFSYYYDIDQTNWKFGSFHESTLLWKTFYRQLWKN